MKITPEVKLENRKITVNCASTTTDADSWVRFIWSQHTGITCETADKSISQHKDHSTTNKQYDIKT